MAKATRFNLGYLVFALLGVLLLHDVWTRASETKPVAYSELERLLEQGKIEEVVVLADRVVGRLKEADGRAVAVAAVRVDPAMAASLDRFGVKYSARLESNVLPTILSWVVPVLIFFGVWLVLARRMAGKLGGPGGGLLSIGKSKAKVYVETEVRTRFADVAGVDEAKAELEETVAFLRDPTSYGRLGARMPKGILLVGPPGTGKTLLARAVAGEAKVPFFSISGSEFVEMFVGVGAARVRDLFEQARQKAPCIIFIDELDALGRARASATGMGGHDEKEQTLNQLLVELDGFDGASGIVLLGATNRPEVLDPALLRAGRFDRQVLVDRPDKPGRAAILRVHMAKVRHGAEVSAEAIAALTPGFTGAELANLVNEAALAATRRAAEAVTASDFTQAIERLVAGAEKRSRLLGPRERSIVAHHEMGHALVAAALPSADRVHKVSIVPRGMGALGYTLQRPSDDRHLLTKEELEQRLTVLLGGRVAEELVFGHLSTGAADDLSRSTDLARDMVTRYGMVPELGHVSFAAPRGRFLGGLGGEERPYSEATAREIDEALRRIVDRAHARARAILERHRALLGESAERLLAEETLDELALAPIFARLSPEPEAPAPVPLRDAA